MPTNDGVYELISTLNSSLNEHALKENVLRQVFDTYWPQFKSRFEAALRDNPAGEHIPARSEESMLSEVLRTIRSLDRRVRMMERSSEATSMKPDKSPRYQTATALQEEIRSLLDHGAPPEVIEEILEDRAPSRAIRELTRAILRDRQNINIESDPDELG